MKADESFEVLGHRFRSKRDFARKLGYKAQLIDSDIIKRYGSFELFVRRIHTLRHFNKSEEV